MIRVSIHLRLAAVALAVAVVPQAMAHAGHDELLRIDVEKDVVRLALSVDGSSLGTFDDNADGKLSKKEFLTHAEAISAWLDQRITIVGKDHQIAGAVFSDLPITNFEALEDADAIDKIRVLRSYPIGKGEGAMLIRFNLFDQHHASRNFDVWRGGKVIGGILTPESNIVVIDEVP